jgi:GxxExxY protein
MEGNRGDTEATGSQPETTGDRIGARLSRPAPHVGLTREIIGRFRRVYNRLDYGYLEHIYRAALTLELTKLGLHVRAEAPLDVWYDGVRIGTYRADLIVENAVVVELKASHALDDTARRQLLNYLRCTDIEVGLLLHFGPKPSVKRLIHTRNIGRMQ